MTKDEVWVYGVGSSVFVNGDIPAVITAVNIRHNDHVTYECSWWNGKEQQCRWLEAFEVSSANLCNQRIGFVGGAQ